MKETVAGHPGHSIRYPSGPNEYRKALLIMMEFYDNLLRKALVVVLLFWSIFIALTIFGAIHLGQQLPQERLSQRKTDITETLFVGGMVAALLIGFGGFAHACKRHQFLKLLTRGEMMLSYKSEMHERRAVFAVASLLLGFLCFAMILSDLRHGEPFPDRAVERWFIVALLLLSVGSVTRLFVIARRTARKHRQFGTVILRLAPGPGIIGGKFSATFNVPAGWDLGTGFAVCLECVEGSMAEEYGKAVWKAEQTISCWRKDRADLLEVPVEFEIPPSAAGTTGAENDADENIVGWFLSIKQVGGSNEATFEVPVARAVGPPPPSASPA